MPYIKQERRDQISPAVVNFCPENAGDLNYVITVMIDNYIRNYGENYANYKEMICAL